jgi:hypothetical protein
MGLSRLENFLKSARGTILYVDPSSLDSTDSIENSGNSLTRPFKTIQRALVEAARFSYQRGQSNDRFNKTTILLYPGDHVVDNRPGYIPTGTGTFSERSGQINLTNLTQWDLDSNFDLSTSDNELYKLNSVYGGVIIPRGTSIVGMDLRKTKIRPTYVPNPENDQIERSCIFRTTGACYFWQFTILDADPNANCFKDYTNNLFVPNFSHHKLSGFEYADGVNGVKINDDFLNGVNAIDTTRTDLDMYYEKVGIVYGPSSGREIQNDYPSAALDIQPVIDEYRIVGPKGTSVGITSIRAGDGVTSSTTITVDLVENIEGLSVDSPIQISGISASGYDGQHVISSVQNDTRITYSVQNIPTNPLPGVAGAQLELVVDTVTSASPYIFNISLRSVYGMCGLLADGDKATGFKSMVVAQYTGIGLQKDDNAFVRYDSVSGDYKDSTVISNLYKNSRARFKPEYENFHIKATNDSFLQLVSVFAIGYAQHFVTENGGDIALNNSNSNFGAKAFVSSGFKRTAFSQDDHGYITHIVPPKEIEPEEISVEFSAIDTEVTAQLSSLSPTFSRLYLYNETNQDNPPNVVIDGYNIGAKINDQLSIQFAQSGIVSTYSSKIVMPDGPYRSTESSSEKSFSVARSIVGINSISSNIITLTEPHSLANGESIRIIADDGNLPDGLEPNQVYYTSLVGITTSNEIYVSKTLSDAITGTFISLNNKGGNLRVVSRVSDKNAGDIGHPVQWDNAGYWFIGVSTVNNGIYNAILTFGPENLGNATSRSYVIRRPDSRSLNDTLYRVRYVIPKDAPTTARPPVDGFILQESNNVIGSGADEIEKLYNNVGPISSTDLRNPKFIADLSWSAGTATVRSEIPHELKVGDEVEIVNVVPSAYNGIYIVTSVLNSKEFRYSLPLNSTPGNFGNDTSARNENLPYLRRKRYTNTFQIYRTEEIASYVPNVQDGVYYLTLINCSNHPTVSPFREEGFAQPIENLFPQLNKDNPNSDPESADSHALPDLIGKVVVNDPQNSITKETLESFVVGFGITDIKSTNGNLHTINTEIDHGLSGITSVSIVSSGTAYGSGFEGTLYNAQLVGFAGSVTGSNATAKITLGVGGTITGVTIIDGGSAYGIGNTLRVVGVSTTTGFVQGVVQVESVSNNIDDTLKITGVSGSANSGYNTLYRVSGITTGEPRQFNANSAETLTTFSTSGIGSNSTANAKYIPTGKVVGISTLVYNSVTGLATAYFSSAHGFRVDNKVSIRGANQSVFNGDFVIEKYVDITELVLNIGIKTTSTSATGTLLAYRPVLTSYGGDLVEDTESVSGRLTYQYAGITTTIGSSYAITATGDLNIPNAISLGFNLGDYVLIDHEIFRIKEAVTSDSVSVYRAVLGSPRQFHENGSIVRRIKVTPVELRRNSIIRASGHTFEYLGYGPGNYSTSLPDKQDRLLSNPEKFLAQATKTDGGIVVYTGMNSDGDFFIGNKKNNSATGKEETYDSPIPTTTAEKNSNVVVNITDSQKIFVEDSIKVEGGRDKNIVSEFDGPVLFNNKVTSNDDIEANSMFLQGDGEISRQISVSSERPTVVGTYGDVKFNSVPKNGGNAGWIYTTNNQWKPFGWINEPLYGVGINSAKNPVGFSTLIDFIGIGMTIRTEFDGIGISTIYFEGDPVNTIGLSSEGTFIGDINDLNLVGSKDGFKFNISIDFDSTVGLATVTFDTPIDIIDFKVAGVDNALGYALPSFATTSIGTRVIYENTINPTNTNYAVGIGPDDSLWWSVPQNNTYSFRWYGGETEVAHLLSDGVFKVFGESTITAGQFISTVTTGTSPISVASSTLVTNFNSNYLDGFVSAATTTPNTIVRRDASNNINGNASHLRHNVSGPQRGEWYADIPARLGYFPFNRAGDTCSGDANFNGLTTIKKVSDIYINRAPVGNLLTCDFNDGPITRTTDTNIEIIDIINVPTTDSRALNYTVVLNAAQTVSNLTNLQFRINGADLRAGGNTIRWLNNLPPSGTAAGYYFFGFSIFRVGAVWEVISVFATYA